MAAVARSHFPVDEGCDSQSRSVALDDPVPSDSVLAVIEPQFCSEEPHRIESEVRRALVAHPELHFKVLVVRRVKDGVCLEGVLDADDDAPDVSRLAGQVEGVGFVINRLLVRTPQHPVRKCH